MPRWSAAFIKPSEPRRAATYRVFEHALIVVSLTAIAMIGFMLTAGIEGLHWPAVIADLIK